MDGEVESLHFYWRNYKIIAFCFSPILMRLNTHGVISLIRDRGFVMPSQVQEIPYRSGQQIRVLKLTDMTTGEPYEPDG